MKTLTLEYLFQNTDNLFALAIYVLSELKLGRKKLATDSLQVQDQT